MKKGIKSKIIILVVLTSNLSFAQENLLMNPGFEKGWEGWTRKNFENNLDTFTTEWKDAHEGVFSFRAARSGGQVDTAWYILSEPMRILGGKPYILTFWSKHSRDLINIGSFAEGGSFDTRIEWLGDQGGLISRIKFNFGPRNTIWHQDRIEAKAPENASYAQVRFGFDLPELHSGNYLIIDDISFTGPPGLTTTTTTSSTSTTTITIIPTTNVSPEQPSAEEKGEMAPCIVQAGFNLTRLELSSVTGGTISIGATVVGGEKPLIVEAFFSGIDIFGHIPLQSIGLLTDPDGDNLYELKFPNIPPGALPPGETELPPGVSIIARDSRGLEDAWPSLTIGGPGTGIKEGLPKIPKIDLSAISSPVPVIYQAGFGLSHLTLSQFDGGEITIRAIVFGGEGKLDVKAIYKTERIASGGENEVLIGNLIDPDGDGAFELRIKAAPGVLPLGRIPLPGLRIIAADSLGRMDMWPGVNVFK